MYVSLSIFLESIAAKRVVPHVWMGNMHMLINYANFILDALDVLAIQYEADSLTKTLFLRFVFSDFDRNH